MHGSYGLHLIRYIAPHPRIPIISVDEELRLKLLNISCRIFHNVPNTEFANDLLFLNIVLTERLFCGLSQITPVPEDIGDRMEQAKREINRIYNFFEKIRTNEGRFLFGHKVLGLWHNSCRV